ncbi:PEP-utilizing enzyme [Escherichia coli]
MKYVLGFVTDFGGRTSHTSHLARSLELPAMVGTNDITERVKNGDMLVLNAKSTTRSSSIRPLNS